MKKKNFYKTKFYNLKLFKLHKLNECALIAVKTIVAKINLNLSLYIIFKLICKHY